MADVNLMGNLALLEGLFTVATLWVIVKWMTVMGMAMYCLFSAVIIKQVGTMAETLDDPANGTVKLFAWVHLVFAVGLTLLLIIVG